MKSLTKIVVCTSLAILSSAAAAQAETTDPPPVPVPQEVVPAPPPEATGFEVSGRFTAQRRPRVTVLDFEDTNTSAQEARYGSSVEAMLVTFLKRKSQFVVVERQKLGTLFEEKHRLQHGMIAVDPGDTSARALLEKIDAFILGNVTVLNIETEQVTRSKPESPAGEATSDSGGGDEQLSRQEKRDKIRGPRIEVDAKLLSRFDGRIIAAAQRSGPVACLRSIVERLGIALEQEFLRPYYGSLKFTLTEPRNVRIFLTPILLDDALDEEKPPVELGATVTIGSDHDEVYAWRTDSGSYTIENLLSGWYTLRLERPGYEGMLTKNARWEARTFYGELEVWDRADDRSLAAADAAEARFVVQVDPLDATSIDGDARKFTFRKKYGSLAPRVMRQYLDTEYSHKPERVVLVGGEDLEINVFEPTQEYADDEKCDLFEELPKPPPAGGSTYVADGQKFDLGQFKGGELIIEDYGEGDLIPVGKYDVRYWEPNYRIERSEVTVRHLDHYLQARAPLIRETLPLTLEATSPRPTNQTILEGRETGHRVPVPLDFSGAIEKPGLPVDFYTASTDISGFGAWRQSVQLNSGPPSPPYYDTSSKPGDANILVSPTVPRTSELPHLTIKTRMGLAGRFDVFKEVPDPMAIDAFLDREVLTILNLLLYGREVRPEKERGGFIKVIADAGVTTVRMLAPALAGQSSGSVAAPAQAGSSAGEVSGPPPPPPVSRYPRDPDELRKLLARRLEVIDLLVLDPADMAQLRKSPDVAAIIQRYVATGGALFAFVAEAGDYGRVVGSPLTISDVTKPTDRFELALGEVGRIVPLFDGKKMKVRSKRALPEIAPLPPQAPWRVLAFTRGRKEPRILESGSKTEGGYVALWLDDPESFTGHFGGTVAKVEETRGRLEERVLDWARFLKYRRYDQSGELRRRAEEAL